MNPKFSGSLYMTVFVIYKSGQNLCLKGISVYNICFLTPLSLNLTIKMGGLWNKMEKIYNF